MASYLIAGGTKGLGKAFAKKVLAAGNTVTLLARNKPEGSFFSSEGLSVVRTDFMKSQSIDSTIEQLKSSNPKFNYIVFFQRFRGNEEDDSWEGEIQVSLNATRKIIEGFAPEMSTEDDNSIVVIASSASKKIATEQDVGYHVAKAALAQLVSYYAVTLGPKRIRVNAISSGAVIKEESSEFYKEGNYPHDLYQSIIPLGRMGHANDVANLANFLCSPQSSFLTGQNIFLDGGLSLVWQESLARTLSPEPK